MSIKKIGDFWKKYEGKIVLTIGLILVATISFEAGFLQGQNWQQKPIIIEKSEGVVLSAIKPETGLKTQNLAPESTLESTEACNFVGSKNSNKYHLPTCTWADRIKDENRICFKSADDAASKGYIPASCMK